MSSGSLSMTSASIGVEKQAYEAAIAKVEEMVGNVNTAIDNGYKSLSDSVSTYWAGAAADAFKDKIKSDSELLMAAIKEIQDNLTAEMDTIGANVQASDESIAEQIKSFIQEG